MTEENKDDLGIILLKMAAAKRFEEMKRDPRHAYDRRRASMLLTMIRSIAYKEVGFNQPLLPHQYLVEKGFTLVEVDDLLPSCLVILAAIFEEHSEVFQAILTARTEKGRKLDG